MSSITTYNEAYTAQSLTRSQIAKLANVTAQRRRASSLNVFITSCFEHGPSSPPGSLLYVKADKAMAIYRKRTDSVSEENFLSRTLKSYCQHEEHNKLLDVNRGRADCDLSTIMNNVKALKQACPKSGTANCGPWSNFIRQAASCIKYITCGPLAS